MGSPLQWHLLVSWLVLQWVGKLGYSTPSISTGMGTGTTRGCWSRTPTHHHKGGLEHQVPPGR